MNGITRNRVRIATDGPTLPEVAAAVVVLALLLAAALVSLDQPAVKTETSTLLVQPGDTLWSIAARHPVDDMDTARLVAYISKTNHLVGGRIVAGDTILVPVEKTGADVAMR